MMKKFIFNLLLLASLKTVSSRRPKRSCVEFLGRSKREISSLKNSDGVDLISLINRNICENNYASQRRRRRSITKNSGFRVKENWLRKMIALFLNQAELATLFYSPFDIKSVNNYNIYYGGSGPKIQVFKLKIFGERFDMLIAPKDQSWAFGPIFSLNDAPAFSSAPLEQLSSGHMMFVFGDYYLQSTIRYGNLPSSSLRCGTRKIQKIYIIILKTILFFPKNIFYYFFCIRCSLPWLRSTILCECAKTSYQL